MAVQQKVRSLKTEISGSWQTSTGFVPGQGLALRWVDMQPSLVRALVYFERAKDMLVNLYIK